MALEKTSYPERILIVLNPDGTLKGAQQNRLEIIKDGGTVLSTKEGPAAPVDGAVLSQIIPDQAALLAQLSTVQAERDTLIIARDNLLSQVNNPGPSVGRVTKLMLIDRLEAAGLFTDALATLKVDPLQYERWQALIDIDPENQEIRALLSAIGGDVDALLSPLQAG